MFTMLLFVPILDTFLSYLKHLRQTFAYVNNGTFSSEGGSLNTPLNTPKCSVRVFRVFMNNPPEYSEYSDYSILFQISFVEIILVNVFKFWMY